MRIRTVPSILVLAIAVSSSALAADFRFQSITSLDDMKAYLTRETPLGISRQAVRKIFVEQGKARLHPHPQRQNIEKYVYDINLCRLYVWRWNISANYDAKGALSQIFVNGAAIHPNGDRALDARASPSSAPPGTQQKILKGLKPRPEASRGENQIAFMMWDKNPASKNVDDKFVIVGHPSRADPNNLGLLRSSESEYWRSIVDDEAAPIADYAGKCPG